MSKGTSSIPCHPPCWAVPSPMGSPRCPFSRASSFPREVTGRGHVALAPWRAFARRLPCTPCHWELVARAGPVPLASYRGHCSMAGMMPGAGRSHSTASPLGCGAWGTPIPGLAGGTWLGLPWPGRSPASSTPSFGGSHPHHRGCHHHPPPASLRCDVWGRETEARPRCVGWGTRCPSLLPAP